MCVNLKKKKKGLASVMLTPEKRIKEQRMNAYELIHSCVFFKLSFGFGLDFKLGLRKLTFGLEVWLKF